MSPPLFAHLVTSGLGPIYDGIAHVFVTFEDLIPIVAIGFLAGQNGPRAARTALLVITVTWFAFGAVGWWAAVPASLPFPGIGLFVLLGVLIALGWPLPLPAIAGLAAILGALHGMVNGADIARDARDPVALVGIAATVFVLMTLSSAHVVGLTAPWSRVAVRVAGSWIAAIGMLMLGWALRG
ncbi:MAG TPA: HupE/UreJ family protein [Vicinamibacterales bacterium]|nr:HupE/UreJ family protein [Vicinamibacterales bacterium]